MRPRLPFGLVAALLAAFAVPALIEQARDVDVLLYMAAAARANAAGSLPYAAAWIEKGPLAMGLFQAIAALDRYSFPVLALAWLALALTGAWLAGRLAREAGAAWAEGWAALLVAVAIGAVGGTLNTEVPAMVFAAAAVLAWLRGRPAAAGALAAGAFLCRQNAGVIWPAFLFLAAVETRHGLAWREAIRRGARVTAGFVLPVAAVAALFAAAGDWTSFVFCTWGYNAGIYMAATHVTAARLARIPWDVAVAFLWPVRTTAALAIAGAALAWRERPAARALAVVAAALVAGSVPGLRFFSHYAAMAVPVAAALGAVGLERIEARSRAKGAIAVALVAFALGTELAERGWLDAGARLVAWGRRAGWTRFDDPLAWPGRDESVVPVATFLRERGTADDRVFVWGMRPHVPVYADRLPATRFVTCTFLTGLVPWERVAPGEDTTPWIVPGAWDLLEDDLARERPRFIVDASADHLFGDGAYAPEKFPRLQAILDRSYRRVFATEGRDRFVVWERVDASGPVSARTPGSADAGASPR